MITSVIIYLILYRKASFHWMRFHLSAKLHDMSSLVRQKFEFQWEILDVIIQGKSSIDSPVGFQIRTMEEAARFVESYGYDIENPIENAEILGNFHEALNFIRKNFLHPDSPLGLRLELPRRILELTDVRELFLMANLKLSGQHPDSQGQYLRNWACSLLKVMHTIAHIDKDLRAAYFPDIQQQIFDRYYKEVHRDSEGNLFLGEKADDPHRVNLVAFETKPKKSRNSIIMKLLHKPENVAEELFDRVGVRFITPTRFGALWVIKYLKDKMIIMPPNIKPSRSRNSLIDLEWFKSQMADLIVRSEKSSMNEKDFHFLLEDTAKEPTESMDNPHSSEHYRAIQFTCRQLIKIKNPVFEEIKEIKNQFPKIDLKYLQREIRFFYPYEVQVVDCQNATENEKGRGAHSEYKSSQLQAALKRVMGTLMDAAR